MGAIPKIKQGETLLVEEQVFDSNQDPKDLSTAVEIVGSLRVGNTVIGKFSTDDTKVNYGLISIDTIRNYVMKFKVSREMSIDAPLGLLWFDFVIKESDPEPERSSEFIYDERSIQIGNIVKGNLLDEFTT